MSARISGRLLAVGAVLIAASILAGCGGAQARKSAHMEKGRKYLAAENFEKARIEFQNALQIDPKDARVRYQVGAIEEKLGHPVQAIQAYNAAIDLAPKHDYLDATVALAKIMALNGAADRALELVKGAMEAHPEDAELYVLRATARALKKDLQGARSDAEHARQLAPRSEDVIAVLAGIYKSQGEADKARELIEQAVQDVPGSAELRFTLAQIYVSQDRRVDAETQYRKIIELKPRVSAHRVRLAQFYANGNQLDAAEAALRAAITDFPDDRRVKLALIEFLAARRTRTLAEEELARMIAAQPKDSELQFALARLYRADGANQKAEAVYRGVIDRERTNPAGLTARNNLAAVRLEQDDLDGALRFANEVIAVSPRDNDALLVRANVELQHQEARGAIADLRTVLRDQPTNPEVLRALANAHIANGEPQIAEQVMRQAADANPSSSTLQRDFAELLTQIGKADEAKTVIASAAERAPGSLELLDTQFRVAMRTHDLQRARAAADAIVARDPKLAFGYMYQGAVAEAEKRDEDALRLYTTAANLRPDTAEPLEAVARMLSSMHRLPEALRRLDDAAARNPQDAISLDVKGELLAQNGRLAEAKEAFRQAIARAPSWWPPYRDMAKAQIVGKEGLPVAIEGLRRAKSIVDPSERLSEMLASLLLRAGKPDEAIGEYEEALRKYPHSDLAANNLAMLLVSYRTDAASLERAHALAKRLADSPNLAYRDTYGWVLYKRGEATAAVPVFERIVAEAPESPVAHYHLGLAQALAGNRPAARDNLTRAIDAGLRSPDLEDAKSAIGRLGGAGGDTPRS